MRLKRSGNGFTLVELLVVIGIIALLIAILLPALNKARLQAKRTQDLSNIRQVAVVCVVYATENKGSWPLGCRGGTDLTAYGDNDDMTWINSYTFAYFLQSMANYNIAQTWLNDIINSPGVANPLDGTIKRRLACTSFYDAEDNQYFATELRDVGQFVGQTQQSSAGPGFMGTNMGFIYWGQRAQETEGYIYDQTGTKVSPATAYTFPSKQNQRTSSQTLLTCPAYSPSSTYSCHWPHSGSNDAFTVHTALSNPGNGLVGDPSAIMNGICCAYTDGSAQWVPRKKLWSMLEFSAGNYQGGIAWMYYDGSPH